jgi:hypothetical protein
MTVSIHQLLKYIVDNSGSDLHITVNSPPQVRIHGKLSPIPGTESLSAAETKQICYSILTDQQKHKFEETLELDLSFGIKGLSRFRGNVFSQRGAVAGAFRTIPYEIRGFKDLGLPAVIERMAEKPRGLILVTGPTGSGKSTTLAAMIDKINRERHDHIVTIEDPVEYLHPHKSCIVNQREIGSDTFSFKAALKSILRQDPDVVLIGEMRDLETIEAALRIAETAHLRNLAHQLGGGDHQPHHRRVPQPPAIPGEDPALLRASGHPVPIPACSAGRQGARHLRGGHGPQPGHPEPHPRGQNPPDVLRHADGPGGQRYANLQPVSGRPLHPRQG